MHFLAEDGGIQYPASSFLKIHDYRKSRKSALNVGADVVPGIDLFEC